jgi:hypothetical protein
VSETADQIASNPGARQKRTWNRHGAKAIASVVRDQLPQAVGRPISVRHQHVATTAIACGEIVVTVSSTFVGGDRSSSEIRPLPYVTSIAGGPLSGWKWTSRTWSKALHNHVYAVGLVSDAFASERA